MKFDEFLSKAVSDCVNGSSGFLYSPARLYESALGEAAREREEHPVHPYSCRDCQRPIRSLEFDGRCRRCAGEEENEAELLARTHEAARQGHRNAARLLHRIGQHDRARIHEEWADRD